MRARLNSFYEKHWWFLPFFSALLLTLSFYPFDFWFLGFIALVPLFYFVNFSAKISLSKIFRGGFIVGAIFSLFLSFFTLIQFHWLPETYLFVWLVRLSPLLIAIMSGLVVGSALAGYKKLALNRLIDIFTLASFSVLIEIIDSKIFFGFNNGLLAYITHHLPFIMALSAIIGVIGVSFIVNLTNAFIAFFIWRPDYGKKIIFSGLISLTILFLINFLNQYYLNGGESDYLSKKFAIVQNADRQNIFGSFQNSQFSFPKAEYLINSAVSSKADFIIYPFSLINGYLADDLSKVENEGLKRAIVGDEKGLGEWIAEQTTDSQLIFINWINVVRGDKLYPEMLFWQNEKQISYYQKRKLFPFMDYTPEIFKKIGLFTTSVDAFASPSSGGLAVEMPNNDVRFGPMICSEIFKSEISRRDAFYSNVFISIGSEAMFGNEIPGKWNLIVSQFVAAANNRPLVRANILGGSALISDKGKLIKHSGFNKTGVLVGEIKYKKSPKNTLYSYFGDLPFIFIILIFLSSIICLKLFKPRKH